MSRDKRGLEGRSLARAAQSYKGSARYELIEKMNRQAGELEKQVGGTYGVYGLYHRRTHRKGSIKIEWFYSTVKRMCLRRRLSIQSCENDLYSIWYSIGRRTKQVDGGGVFRSTHVQYYTC